MQKQTIQTCYFEHVEQQNITEKTKSQKTQLIAHYIEYIDGQNIDINDGKAKLINEFMMGYSYVKPSTFNHYLAIFRDFYGVLYHQRLIAFDWSIHLQNKKEPDILPRNIPLTMMLRLCTPTANESDKLQSSIFAKRDQAIIEFMFSTGIRNAELREAKLKYLSKDLSEYFVLTKKKRAE